MKIKWHGRYSLNNDRIDMQHRKLLHLAGEAQCAKDKASYQACVMQLYRQFRIHFDDEEALMREVNYPSMAAHCKAHTQMITILNEMSKEIAQDRWDSDIISNFMNNIVCVHILTEDFILAEFIRTQQDIV